MTKPIIEKVEFPQNGKTLTQEDTLELLVYAKDMESGINRAEAYVYFQMKMEMVQVIRWTLPMMRRGTAMC